jgi:transcriptional regulator with XRE-family HTH domain
MLRLMQNDLKAWRARREIDQRRLSARCGIRYHRYMDIENDLGKDPTPEEQSALAAALNCLVRDLFPKVSKSTASAA